MDYKIKYKEALEGIRELYNSDCDMIRVKGLRRRFEHIFPELKESEDERIKREIIDFLRLPHHQFAGKRDHEKWIAWLERQKDYIKLPNSPYTSSKDVIEFADKYSHTVWENLMDNFKKIKNYHIGCNDVSDIVLNAIINTYNWLEKQSEQIPVEWSEEDEKIEREIVAYINELADLKNEKIPTKWLAWLEKQKKAADKEIIFRPIVGTDIRIAAKQALEKIDIGKKVVLAFNGAYIPVNGKTVGEIGSEYDAWLEKQGKKKPTEDVKTLDANKVIEWLKENVADFWANPCNPN